MGRTLSAPRAALLIFLLMATYSLLLLYPRTDGWQDSFDKLRNKWRTSRFCSAPQPGEDFQTGWGQNETSIYENMPVNDSTATSPTERRANAAFIFLARNSELRTVIESIQQMEDRFNKKYKYPYIFLNDEPFSDEFKEWTSAVISSSAQYGVIPHDHWNQPDWIDEERAKASREAMVDANIIYGGSVSYRNMCRFNSGFFFKHELVQPYRWYWRIEPGVKFYCDIDFDPFLQMEDANQVYGFNIALYEFEATIPTLWKTTKEFIKQHPQYVSKGNAMKFLSPDGGNTYNMCHFWSNFEIADMNFWRGEAYSAYFDWLESEGGFYYERWGDAPVHSIAAALFLRKEQIRFFDEIGYRHEYIQHCPTGEAHLKGKCSCHPDDSFDWTYYSCLWDFSKLFE